MPAKDELQESLVKENFDELAQEAWKIILFSIQDLKEKKHTFSEIAQILGIKNRSLVCEWLNKKRELPLSSFAAMLHYLDIFGYAIIGNQIVKTEELESSSHMQKIDKKSSPSSSKNIKDLEEEIKLLKEENNELKVKSRMLQEILTNAIDTKKLKKSQKKDKN